ncbi:odorant receptor 13a-like [Leguminivora glycinivorella]|uniref:odorant receptor 13a-like n=1 Tax=Leguminivora glycinivorella TaxID=1035111 RepID=UPI00200EC560|nr:odorant receptor 13a-like [Leguminivora glycinivorella]
MFNYILKKLENPKRPLLGPNVKALQFWGLLLPENVIMKYIYICLHISIIYFTATEYVDIWFIKSDINLILENLKITMLASVSVVKISTFLIWQKSWRDIIDYVTESDVNQRKTTDEANLTIIKQNTKYSRKITYLYWSLMYTTVVVVIVQPIMKYVFSQTYRDNVKSGEESYIQVVSSWVPFDKSNMVGYVSACAFQSYAAIYGGGWITSFDTNAIVTMVFFKGELQLLKRDSAKIFGIENNPVSREEAERRLKECHRRHANLIKYSSLFDSCLSPIMLFYMFVCSVMLCVTAYQIRTGTSMMQTILQVEYLVFGVSQLFMYCWHSNDVMQTSQEVIHGPYESRWWSNNALRQDLVILLGQFRKEIVFSAGPFTNLTLPTFINILKGAYSYYTLLTKSQIDV